MRYRELIESPELIDDENWNLSNPKANRKKANEILKYNPTTIEQFPSSKLIHLGGNVGGQMAVIERDGLLSYYMHYELHNVLKFGLCATQVKLWRSFSATVPRITAKVFDGFLLPKFNTIISDSRQTSRGREFWIVQLSSNSEVNVVGVILDKSLNIYKKEDHASVGDWIASINAWGKGSKYRQIQFFITNKSIGDIS